MHLSALFQKTHAHILNLALPVSLNSCLVLLLKNFEQGTLINTFYTLYYITLKIILNRKCDHYVYFRDEEIEPEKS